MAIGLTIAGIAALTALLAGGNAALTQNYYNNWGGTDQLQKDWIKNYRAENPDDEFLNSLTDSELLGMLQQYEYEPTFWDTMGAYFDPSKREAEYLVRGDEFIEDLNRLRELEYDRPEQLNREEIFAKAGADIASDDARARQSAQQEIQNLQQTYGTARQDILGQQQEQYKGILGQVGSEMDKSRQTALEAGASAGLRLAGNVNVLLSAQNKQRATSLDTANNLTQMLLNLQNQAMGVRRDVNQLDATRAQRTTQNQQQQYGAEQSIYNNELNNWNDRWNESTRNVDPGLRDAYSSWQNRGN
jgi:hypothetical protein